jgi:hypothetical protein
MFGFSLWLFEKEHPDIRPEGLSDERSSNINHIRRRLHTIFTHLSPVLRKAEAIRAPLLLLAAICLVTLPACSTLKGAAKPKQARPAPESSLIGQDQDEVKKKLGEPTDVSKTAEGNLLWVYRPSWTLLPTHKGTQYVEFKDGKVVKVFKER